MTPRGPGSFPATRIVQVRHGTSGQVVSFYDEVLTVSILLPIKTLLDQLLNDDIPHAALSPDIVCHVIHLLIFANLLLAR